MSLSDYLAKNYLNADHSSDGTKPSKKRKKRQHADNVSGINITDDDAPAWTANIEEDLHDAPQTIVSHNGSVGFRKKRDNAWTSVGAPAPSNTEQAAADAIIASTAIESAAYGADQDDGPQVVEETVAITMESGAHAGLQSAEQVTAALQKRKAEERRRFEAEGPEKSGKGQETIYRDASGRIINVAMKRAEARRVVQEAEKAKAAELEASKGDVQRLQKEARANLLADAKYMSVARHADDADLNEELKERDRWNDPAAQFLTKKKSGKSASGKPIYQGAAPPNRYGIRPGHRWDGVDRSTNFEKEYFAAQNRKKNVKDLSYQWQYDV